MKREEMLGDKIQKALDVTSERVRQKNKDFVCLVTGGEGNGKSSIAMEMAAYMDEDFDVQEQVCMDHENFIRTADELDPHQSIVFDEGVEALLSRNHGKKKNKIMIEWIREVRAKNLNIFLILPEFKEVEKPVRDDRAHALVRCVKQGWAHFFNKPKMNEITVKRNGNRVDAEFPDPLFRDEWEDPAGSAMWDDYLGMKTENVENLAGKYLDDEDDEKDDYEKKYRRLRKKIAKTFVKHLGMNQSDAANLVGVTPEAYSKWKTRGNLGNLPPFDISEHLES